MEELRLGFLSSHGGTNMQAIFDATFSGKLNAKLCVVISNNSNSSALKRAQYHHIPAEHLSSNTHPNPDDLDGEILATLKKYDVYLVILAGYMKKLGPKTTSHFKNKILNIHPALLPEFGGKGMYGKRVHQAVIDSKATVTGVTVHLVNEDYDRGPILAQKQVPVRKDDTAETLADRVLAVEHQLYYKTLQKIYAGSIKLDQFNI